MMRDNPCDPRAGRAGYVAIVSAALVALSAVGASSAPKPTRAITAIEPAILLIGPDRPAQLCTGMAVGAPVACGAVASPHLVATDGDLGDLDGDGRVEAVLVDQGEPYACRLDVPSALRCQKLATRPSLWRVQALALSDLDGDGRPELVVQHHGEAPLVCRGGLGSGFDCTPLAEVGAYGQDLAPGDLDGDGDPDLAVDTALADHGAQVCRNDGRGNLACQPLAPAEDITALRIGDADGDGVADVLLSLNFRRGYVLCLGQGDLAFDCRPLDLGADSPPGPTTDATVARQGPGMSPELVIAGWPTRLCRLAARGASGPPALTCRADAFDGLGSRAVAAADLDGDGIDEVVLGGTNQLCRRAGPGSFTCMAIGDPEANAQVVAVSTGATLLRPTPAVTATAEPPRTVTPWPATPPTPLPTDPVQGAPPLDAVEISLHGQLSLPAVVRHLRVDGTRAVAFGGQCDTGTVPFCRAVAVLVDLANVDQPRVLGAWEPGGTGDTLVDAHLYGPALYVVVERHTSDEVAPIRRRLVVVDITDPLRPRAVAESDLGPPGGLRYPEPGHGGLARIDTRLIWGTSSSLRVFDLGEPLRLRLTARLALPSSALAGAGAWLLVAEPAHGLRILDMTVPARPRDLGSLNVHAAGRGIDSLVGIIATGDRAYVTLRLQCAEPVPDPRPPSPGLVLYPCGSALAEVHLEGPPRGPRQFWTGLATAEHGLGAAQLLGDMLLVAQGRLVVLDAQRPDHPILAEINLTRDVGGGERLARPYDLALAGGRVLMIERVDDQLPARLLLLDVQRRPRLFLPRVARSG